MDALESFTYKRRRIAFFGLIICANIFIWYALSFESGGNLKVSFLDVGQGDAVFIQAPDGRKVLVDGGPNDKVVSDLGTVMPFYDRSIDMIIATHPDQDHIGGLVSVLKKYQIGFDLENGGKSAAAVYEALESAENNSSLRKMIARSGESVVLDKKRGVVLSVLFPYRDISGIDTNDGSVVLKLSYGKTCFILTGDAPQAVEKYLVKIYGQNLNCEVLKAGHHGSKTSSAREFVAAVAPKYAVISVGKDNRYGHPNIETLETFNSFGAKILRTDELGTITFVSDGEKIERK